MFDSGLVAVTVAADVCDPGWLAYGGNCYKFTSNKWITRSSAAMECDTSGASLLRPRSTAEIVS